MPDSFSDGLKRFQRKVRQALPRDETVQLTMLFHPDFMASYTDAPDFETFLRTGGYGTTAEEFAAIPHDEFDAHVRAHSGFASWDEMQQTAVTEYMRRRLRDAGL